MTARERCEAILNELDNLDAQTRTEADALDILEARTFVRSVADRWESGSVDPAPRAGERADGVSKAMRGCGIAAAQESLGRWARRQFPEQTRRGIITHLREEVEELAGSQGVDLAEEAADVVILALVLADHEGFSLDEAIDKKHRKNEQRRWGAADANGIHHHLVDEAGEP